MSHIGESGELSRVPVRKIWVRPAQRLISSVCESVQAELRSLGRLSQWKSISSSTQKLLTQRKIIARQSSKESRIIVLAKFAGSGATFHCTSKRDSRAGRCGTSRINWPTDFGELNQAGM